MVSDDQKPREWWLMPQGLFAYDEEPPAYRNAVCVIEKSAYDALVAQLAEANSCAEGSAMLVQSSREKVERLERALTQIANIDLPSASDKTAWIVMLESIVLLAKKTLERGE